MARCIVPAAEKILDREFSVLDKGFVRLVDYMGSDERIVQAARVSYGEGTKAVRQDAGLIDYLLRNDHTSPFEQVVFTFHAKMPIFVARQWVRHRTARVNEISGRYSVMPKDFYSPPSDFIAEQSSDNKQGRKEVPMNPNQAQAVQKTIKAAETEAYRCYEELLEMETARELARMVLPLNLYTEWYWQIDLHNLFRFLKLRLDPHAQKEIRVYAEKIRDISSLVCPLAFNSFNQHIAGGVRFSRNELTALRRMQKGENHGLTGREAERFELKLADEEPQDSSNK